jgi:CHAT domain-containing protein
LVSRWFFIPLFLAFHIFPDQGPDNALSKYREALAFYEATDPTDYTDSMSLVLFQELLHSEEGNMLEDKIRLDIFEKSGNLALIKGNLTNAVAFYREGLAIKDKGTVNDTLFFASNLFLGESYYLLSQADSSIYFLEEAAKIIQQKFSDTESSRLYNSLGVIYFESGNYVQSVNYFNKAKNLIIENRSYDKLEPYFQYALFSFLNNIGSSLLQLNKLDSALAIYKELEDYGFNKDQVYTQMASIYLEKSMPDSALVYLNKIGSEEFSQSVSYQNQLAEIYFQRNEFEKAKDVLLSFLSKTSENGSNSSNFRLGRSYTLLGKIAYEERDYDKALGYFHQAVIYIDGYFDQQDVFKNPEDYTLGFATFSLIESLVNKAKSLIRLYEVKKDNRYFKTGIATYQTAFDMAFFVSNYYDNDEARIFLGDYVFETYQDAVNTVLERFQEGGEKEYLIQALEWSERSKSTSLNIGLREKKLKKISGISPEKLQQERDLQFAISKIQRSILSEKNDDQVFELQKLLTDRRLELSRLHNELNDSPEYVKEKLNYESIDIPYIQKEILDRNTIIISFFETKSNFILFLLDKKEIDFRLIEKSEDIDREIKSFKKNIIDYKLGQKYVVGVEAMTLYKRLFGDIHYRLVEYKNLLIIAHGDLIDLPFEVLEYQKGKYLLNNHAIAYQYSMQLMGKTDLKPLKKANKIGFAPFYDHSWSDETVMLSKLPYSGQEIGYLEGTNYSGKESTKEALLEILPEADYLQLSTHAIPDPQNPDLAFIALYPGDIEDRLFTNEVVNMDLSHTSLVFLSACETNFGSLSRSEGALSISRAFMLAGCQNIISSLWKAEDKSTAYITEAFYKNVMNGYSFSEALQNAKLDLLSDPKMAQYHHPVFWAHLVLVGHLNKPKQAIPLYLYLFAAVVLLGGYWVFHSRYRKKAQKTWIFFY